jgi:hypothetical protein
MVPCVQLTTFPDRQRLAKRRRQSVQELGGRLAADVGVGGPVGASDIGRLLARLERDL